MTKKPLKPFIEEWKTTRYIHFIFSLLALIIGLVMVKFVDFGLGALITSFSMFLFGSFFAYEDVYRELKKKAEQNVKIS